MSHGKHGRSQNAVLVPHIEGRLLKRTVISIMNCVPFHKTETSLKGKNSLLYGANSFL